MFCENCGTELQDPNQKFCPNCGIPLRRIIIEFDEFREYRRMDQQISEDIFTPSFENLKSINNYVQIHSDWARGNKEMLEISIILDQQIPPEIEESILKLCVEFSERIQSYKEIYKAFYIKDLDSFDTNEKELIAKNKALLEMEVNNLRQSIDELIRDFLEKKEVNEDKNENVF